MATGVEQIISWSDRQYGPEASELKEIFLSYSHKDRLLARRVKRRLKGSGWAVFLAHEDIRVSSTWRTEILKHLEKCSAVMVIATPNAAKSTWSNQEVGIAMGKGKPIAPLLFGRHDNLVSFLEMLQAEHASRKAVTKRVVRNALQTVSLQGKVQRSKRALVRTTNYGLIARWKIYATLDAICEKISREAPKPGAMIALTYGITSVQHLTKDDLTRLWNKGDAIPSIRLSEPQIKSIDDIMIQSNYLIDDSTANAWKNVLRKAVYGLGPVQYDIELQSFTFFCKDVHRHYTNLKRATQNLGVSAKHTGQRR